MLRHLFWLLAFCSLLSSGFFACDCGTGPQPEGDGGGNDGSIITPDGSPIQKPASWGTRKMKKGEACGTFKWDNLDCEDGLVCIKDGDQGLCLQSCDPNGAACPSNLPCREVVSGTWACLTNTPLTAKGGECESLPCQPPLACVQANYEKVGRCRPGCDPHPDATNACDTGYICGILPSGGGACVPRPEGTVDEFGKCGGSFGNCKASPVPLECVINSSRNPSWGSCLRPCSDTSACPTGLVCIKSVGACAKECDPDASNCDYGTCNTLASDQSVSVCY